MSAILHNVVKIPVLKSSQRLIVVSKAPIDADTCDSICQAQGASSFWLPVRWDGIGAPPSGKGSGSVKVWLLLSEEDHSDLLDMFGAVQDACQDMMKSGGYQRNKATLPKNGEGKAPYVSSYLPLELNDDPVWVFDGKEVKDDPIKPSDLAKLGMATLAEYMIQDQGAWIGAMHYGPITGRLVVKPAPPAKPEAPVKPEAPAKPKAPAKPVLTDVTKEVQAKLGIS